MTAIAGSGISAGFASGIGATGIASRLTSGETDIRIRSINAGPATPGAGLGGGAKSNSKRAKDGIGVTTGQYRMARTNTMAPII
jgi:hypothetical protein